MRMLFLMMVLGVGCAGPVVADAPDASTPAAEEPVPEQTCQSTYVVCGCGCCGGAPESAAPCLTCDGGKALQDIITEDKKRAKSPQCAYAGCSFPVRYSYCTTAP